MSLRPSTSSPVLYCLLSTTARRSPPTPVTIICSCRGRARRVRAILPPPFLRPLRETLSFRSLLFLFSFGLRIRSPAALAVVSRRCPRLDPTVPSTASPTAFVPCFALCPGFLLVAITTPAIPTTTIRARSRMKLRLIPALLRFSRKGERVAVRSGRLVLLGGFKMVSPTYSVGSVSGMHAYRLHPKQL